MLTTNCLELVWRCNLVSDVVVTCFCVWFLVCSSPLVRHRDLTELAIFTLGEAISGTSIGTRCRVCKIHVE